MTCPRCGNRLGLGYRVVIRRGSRVITVARKPTDRGTVCHECACRRADELDARDRGRTKS